MASPHPPLAELCQTPKRLLLSHKAGNGSDCGPLLPLLSESSDAERIWGILLLQVLNLLNY